MWVTHWFSIVEVIYVYMITFVSVFSWCLGSDPLALYICSYPCELHVILHLGENHWRDPTTTSCLIVPWWNRRTTTIPVRHVQHVHPRHSHLMQSRPRGAIPKRRWRGRRREKNEPNSVDVTRGAIRMNRGLTPRVGCKMPRYRGTETRWIFCCIVKILLYEWSVPHHLIRVFILREYMSRAALLHCLLHTRAAI